MKCPKCGKEISFVGVYSHCIQKGTLNGNKIVDYESPEVTDTITVNCPECDANIIGFVEET